MAIKYGPVTSTPDGIIFSEQSSAGRSKKKWLLLRHGGPSDSGEIIYEHGARFESLSCEADGQTLHAICQRGFHHTNEGGDWKKQRIAKDRTGHLVAKLHDRLFFGVSAGELYERADAAYALSLEQTSAGSTDFVSSMDATPEAIYAARGDGKLLRYVKAWEDVASPRLGPCSVLARAEDELYVSSYFGLFRGSAAAGLEKVIETRLQYGCRHGDMLVVASYSGGVFRVEGDALEPLGDGFSVTYLDGAGAYLCATGMAPEIQLFDGKRWATITSES